MSDVYLKIGSSTPANKDHEAIIDREWYSQGFVVKDEETFLKFPDKPCYIPELSDDVYTRNDLIALCAGNEELATQIFYALDWQSPSTELEQLCMDGELGWCPDCKKYYELPIMECDVEVNTEKCPLCGTPLE